VRSGSIEALPLKDGVVSLTPQKVIAYVTRLTVANVQDFDIAGVGLRRGQPISITDDSEKQYEV
jgi:hypothetical protein